MSDDQKTKQELMAEIEVLRKELARREGDSAAGEQDLSAEPSFARPMTRREVLGGWIAPVILSIPLAAATRSGAVRAGIGPMPDPTPFPTGPEPTPEPTPSTPVPPTPQPSPPTPQPSPPTPQPSPPTPQPSPPTPQPSLPTPQPTSAPTPVPTAFPTVAPSARPIPALGLAGAAALGAGLAALGAKARKSRDSAGDDPDAGGVAGNGDKEEGNGNGTSK